MYKGNSKSLQRAHGVHRVQAAAAPGDALPEIAAMGLADAQAEHTRLQAEIARVENELIVAKRRHDPSAIGLGARKSSIQARLSAVKTRLRALNQGDSDRAWRQAVREVCPDQYDAVLLRKIALQRAARGGA